MSSRSLRNPGRLSRSHSGRWSASWCSPDSLCGCIARKGLGRHQGRKDTKVVTKQGTYWLSTPGQPWVQPVYLMVLEREALCEWLSRQSSWDLALLLWEWEELELMTRRWSLTTTFRKEVFPGINFSAGQHVRMIAFTSCFVSLSCHLLGRLGLTHKEASTRCHRSSSLEQEWHVQSALIAHSD